MRPGRRERFIRWKARLIKKGAPLSDRQMRKQKRAISRLAMDEGAPAFHLRECAFREDTNNGFDHPRACDCGYDAWIDHLWAEAKELSKQI